MGNKEWRIVLLVFTNDGTVHKISVGNIDASRGSFKDNIVNILNLSDKNNIAHIDMGGDYSKYITFIYKNGRGLEFLMTEYQEKEQSI